MVSLYYTNQISQNTHVIFLAQFLKYEYLFHQNHKDIEKTKCVHSKIFADFLL